MNSSTLDDYRQRIADIDPDKIIGSVLWFSINRPRVTIDEMQAWFVELGLDERYLPNPIKPVDAFRDATGNAKAEYDLPGEGMSASLSIREVAYDNDSVERHIIRETRDRKSKRLYHDKVGEAVFYRRGKGAKAQGQGGEKVRFTGRWELMQDDAETSHLKTFMDKVFEEYRMLCQFPTANAVRATIRNYVVNLNSIAVRPSGGVYFVHASRQTTVDQLQTFVRRIANGSTLHTLPLVDTGEQREMLADAFQDEVSKAVDTLLKDVARLNEKYAKGKVPPREYAKANAAYQELQERAREYTDILQLGMGTAATALEVALDSVMDLANRIDPGGK